MIQLQQPLRNNSKFLKLIDKYTPDTFELKIARKLDSFVRDSFIKYQNYDFGELWRAEYCEALASKQRLLEKHSLFIRLEENYFKENTDHTLLSFYSNEILEFTRIRDIAANSFVNSLTYIIETLSLSNNAISSELNKFQRNINLFFRNHFIIEEYKRKNHDAYGNNDAQVNQFYINKNNFITKKSVVFNNSMTIEGFQYYGIRSKIDKLQKLYNFRKPFKTKKEHAYIIEYFIAERLGLHIYEHSKRKDQILKLYDVAYKTYYQSQIDYSISSNRMRKPDLAYSILFVDENLKNGKNRDTFDVDLLEEMVDYFETL